jgi:NADH pyrophosphatase NudC (nudix superfamily)
MKLTQEDIKKYGTRDEILFLEADKKKRTCSRCGKTLKTKEEIKNKVCDLCADDIDRGRDKE